MSDADQWRQDLRRLGHFLKASAHAYRAEVGAPLGEFLIGAGATAKLLPKGVEVRHSIPRADIPAILELATQAINSMDQANLMPDLTATCESSDPVAKAYCMVRKLDNDGKRTLRLLNPVVELGRSLDDYLKAFNAAIEHGPTGPAAKDADPEPDRMKVVVDKRNGAGDVEQPDGDDQQDQDSTNEPDAQSVESPDSTVVDAPNKAPEQVDIGEGCEVATPRYDSVRRLLTYQGKTIKQFKQPAKHQECVLRAFEEDGWRPKIDDPLPRGKLPQTIRDLNRNMKDTSIRFEADGTGEGVMWNVER